MVSDDATLTQEEESYRAERDAAPFGRCCEVLPNGDVCLEPLESDVVNVCSWHLARTLKQLRQHSSMSLVDLLGGAVVVR